MPAVFLVSDTHFVHRGVCEFLREDGTKMRPWTSVEDMDEHMVQAWNSRVGPRDKVYHLGDVVINRRALATVGRLNGDKVLIKGNHDIYRLGEYAQYFRDVRAYHVLNGMIFSHIPVHAESLGRFGANIHGHLHYRRVRDHRGDLDPRYYCVSVEHLPDWAPIALDLVLEHIQAQGGETGFRNGNGPTL